uniref:Uncharacterized protein n=1 Tax=Janibacter limosus TaxID=53458 RepID=A0AC61U8C8_9MICO|nr:hypothetical protein [Janibacter limosus]
MREVLRPDKTVRRKQGKSDPIDAYHAARAVLSGAIDLGAQGREDPRSARPAHRATLSRQGPHRDDPPDPTTPDHRPRRHPGEVPRPEQRSTGRDTRSLSPQPG